ncbi:hypothetical protein AWU65_20410 [Paenibacillus glucanolyticus]|uniref:Uncharacterized protein n=1 Tax=Paenibacillus glucanolyticus TaxID=59843 RepID=A0A163LGT8_9BACL|nr:hypothetical protein [Paenibacillus glucanolyticus]KZS48121.1 hypothetical protein AWU65_20410 [Paenibacillus glucanolyticus]
MLLKDVVEEIAEKAPNFLSPASIVRKVTQVRDRLLRQSGGAQQQADTVCTAIDLTAGQSRYVLPCPPGNVVDVDMIWDEEWRRIPLRQFHQRSIKPYYYFQAGELGLVPTPEDDCVMGLKIFHIPVLPELRLTDMNGPTGFDPDYDMVLVFGVLREITSGRDAQEYDAKYQELLSGYQSANSGWERYEVKERW